MFCAKNDTSSAKPRWLLTTTDYWLVVTLCRIWIAWWQATGRTHYWFQGGTVRTSVLYNLCLSVLRRPFQKRRQVETRNESKAREKKAIRLRCRLRVILHILPQKVWCHRIQDVILDLPRQVGRPRMCQKIVKNVSAFSSAIESLFWIALLLFDLIPVVRLCFFSCLDFPLTSAVGGQAYEQQSFSLLFHHARRNKHNS